MLLYLVEVSWVASSNRFIQGVTTIYEPITVSLFVPTEQQKHSKSKIPLEV